MPEIQPDVGSVRTALARASGLFVRTPYNNRQRFESCRMHEHNLLQREPTRASRLEAAGLLGSFGFAHVHLIF